MFSKCDRCGKKGGFVGLVTHLGKKFCPTCYLVQKDEEKIEIREKYERKRSEEQRTCQQCMKIIPIGASLETVFYNDRQIKICSNCHSIFKPCKECSKYDFLIQDRCYICSHFPCAKCNNSFFKDTLYWVNWEYGDISKNELYCESCAIKIGRGENYCILSKYTWGSEK